MNTKATTTTGYQDVAGKQHWEQFWDAKPPQTYRGPPLWHPLVSRYLPKREDASLFEIGCVPGMFLVYFYKEFGYIPSGLDYLPRLDVVRNNLRHNDVPEGDFYEADLFQFEPPKLYDVVCSHGFIEHFEDYPRVIAKHVDFVAPGGYLILAVPNYTHLQYLIRFPFDAKNLAKHRFEVMNPRVIRDCLTPLGMKIDYCGYAATFDYWIVRRGSGLRRRLAWFFEGVGGRIERMLTKTGLGQIPNRLLSPYTVCIARRPAS